MLSLEPLLRARLGTVASLKGVHGLTNLTADTMSGKQTPCAFVVFDGYKVLENSSNGSASHIATRWLVVAAVRNATNAADGKAMRADADLIVSDILSALLGWRAGNNHEPLMLADAPSHDYEAGHLWVPLSFECRQVIKAA